MKPLTRILFAGLMLAGINSAFADQQDRHLSGFHAITSNGSYDLYITQGANESVKVEAPTKVINNIITEVKGGELKIYTKNGFHWDNWFNNEKMAIYITVKNIDAIGMTGSGDVFFKEGLRGDKLTLSVTGSGDFSGKVDVRELESRISGSGDMTLSGHAESSSIRVSGSGDFKARDLATANTSVSVSGSGDATVNASTKLDARVSGSGDIRYTGAVKNVSSSTSGSGDINRF